MRAINRNSVSCLVLIILVFLLSCDKSSGEAEFTKGELEWRRERDSRMRRPDSWLTIAGLYWLREGGNSFGTDSGNSIVLPEGSAPPFAGRFMLRGSETRVISLSGTGIKYMDSTITEMALRSDAEGKPDIIELNDLKMWVIKRGGRFAIRLRDLNARRYKEYSGLDFFPPRKEYLMQVAFVPFTEPKKVKLVTVVGTEAEMVSPGYVGFRIDDRDLRLDVFETEPGSSSLFIIFKDKTGGTETYGACRFMVADLQEDGNVRLNFNRAYNPPCAYTPYATCPLPPPQNDLPVRIEAGEKRYGKNH